MSGSAEADRPGEKQLQNCLQFTESEGYSEEKFLFKQGACACDHTYTEGTVSRGVCFPEILEAEIMEQVYLLLNLKVDIADTLELERKTIIIGIL